MAAAKIGESITNQRTQSEPTESQLSKNGLIDLPVFLNGRVFHMLQGHYQQ